MQEMSRMQKREQYFINKTKSLEEGIVAFPSLFIEGAAACGKTTAMEMLLKAYPEVESEVIYMDRESQDLALFCAKLEACGSYINEKTPETPCWMIFENITREIPASFFREIAQFIWWAPENVKVFLISREKPAKELLELLWKRKMGMISQRNLAFSQTEVEKLVSQRGSMLRAEEVYRETGGWPGCVDLILYLSEQLGEKDVKKLCQRYEVQAYIQNEILDTLSKEEKEVFRRAEICPWINEKLCEEVWGISWAAGILEELERKGLLLYDEHLHRWKTAPLLKKEMSEIISYGLGKCLGEWYQAQGAVAEAFWCLDAAKCDKEYQMCMITHFEEVPQSFLMQTNVMEWKDNIPQLCYLRGRYCYYLQDFSGLHKEMMKAQQLEGELAKEVYLNLAFINPEIPLDMWLELLEELTEERKTPVHLYHFSENAHTYLSGLRELSGLFSCMKKEEKRRMKLLKETLGEEEWTGIQLARVDYYLETGRRDAIPEEDWRALRQITAASFEKVSWQYQMACLYILNIMQNIHSDQEISEYIVRLEDRLFQKGNEVCQNYVRAIRSLYTSLRTEESLTRWLKQVSAMKVESVNETNYNLLLFQTKGFLLLNQYDRANQILRRVIPYLKKYHRSRFLAELLFQQAIINWADGKRGAALRNVIESFLVTGEYRYVRFYTEYGKFGKEVLDAYVEWFQNNEPERWNRKKSYNYGNVLRMPIEDYLEVILRAAKRGVKLYVGVSEKDSVERLTMMETLVLQDINRGLTNAEICSELNLKLPTVKSHIYSVYKKLGVNSRVQAILKGKELGIIK